MTNEVKAYIEEQLKKAKEWAYEEASSYTTSLDRGKYIDATFYAERLVTRSREVDRISSLLES